MSLPDETRNERGTDDFNHFLRELQKQARRFWDYVRTRSSECWLFFAAGLVVGLFIG